MVANPSIIDPENDLPAAQQAQKKKQTQAGASYLIAEEKT